VKKALAPRGVGAAVCDVTSDVSALIWAHLRKFAHCIGPGANSTRAPTNISDLPQHQAVFAGNVED
jgi:hypothetical protein